MPQLEEFAACIPDFYFARKVRCAKAILRPGDTFIIYAHSLFVRLRKYVFSGSTQCVVQDESSLAQAFARRIGFSAAARKFAIAATIA